MAFYQLKTSQKLPASLDEVWDFISSPANLQKITPEGMGFEITSGELPEKMYPGMIISYRVKPLAGIPAAWVSEITQIKEKEYFIDEQRMGPYKMWHHQHWVKPIEGGVLMEDVVSYQPPFGFIGSLANAVIIRKKLNQIFSYREKAMEDLFGVYKENG